MPNLFMFMEFSWPIPGIDSDTNQAGKRMQQVPWSHT